MNLGVGVTIDELESGDGPHPAPSPKIDEHADETRRDRGAIQ
jgi:hypothetical protein